MKSQVSRRDFLSVAAAGIAGFCVMPGANVATAYSQPKPISFGFSLYGMRSLSLDEGLETCASIGYDAIELAAMADWPADPQRLSADERKRLGERIRSLRLQLPALMENLPLDVDDAVHHQQLDRLKAVAELAHDLAPAAPPLIETILGGKVGQWDEVKQRFAARLGDWANIADQTHTVVTIKPHRFGAMNTPEQAVWLVDQVNSPWIKLAYDYSHFQHRDLPVDQTIKAMLPQTQFIHVKDTVVENGKARFVLPGEGETDYVDLLRRLQGADYGGCVCIEVSGMVQSRPGYDGIAAAKKCYEKLAPAFEKAGIRRKA